MSRSHATPPTRNSSPHFESSEPTCNHRDCSGSTTTRNDLAAKVWRAIEHDVTEMGLGSPNVRRRDAEHARPLARHDGDSLVIENKSESVTAEQFRFISEGVSAAGFGGGGGQPVDLFYDGEPFDLLPQAEMRWSMAVFMQSPPQLKLTMRWLEDGEPQEVTQIVAL